MSLNRPRTHVTIMWRARNSTSVWLGSHIHVVIQITSFIAPEVSIRRAALASASGQCEASQGRRGPAPLGADRGPGKRLLADALDQEGHAHERAPLVEVVAAQPGRNYIDRLDVAQRRPGLCQRRLDRV